jgi:hypothetical protein
MAEGYDEPISEATKARARREGWSHMIEGLSEVQRYRRRSDAVEAFKYDGTFPLRFLKGNEQVGRGSRNVDGQVYIYISDHHAHTADMGDWIVRDPMSGLSVMDDKKFCTMYYQEVT